MRLPLLRKVATGVLLLDALAIGAAALHVENVITRTTTALPPVASAPAAPGSVRAVSPGLPPAPQPVVLPGTVEDPFADALAQLEASAGTDEPAPAVDGPIVTPPPGAGGVPAETPVLPACPIDLGDPGLQAAVAPVLAPLATGLGALLAPVLETEAQLVAALAPYAQALTGAELGGCITVLQDAPLGLGGPR